MPASDRPRCGRRHSRHLRHPFLRTGACTISIAKVIEISAESPTSYEDAIKRGIAEASKTVDDIRGAWVKDHEVLVSDGGVTAHRVDLKVTFVIQTGA